MIDVFARTFMTATGTGEVRKEEPTRETAPATLLRAPKTETSSDGAVNAALTFLGFRRR